MKNFIFAILLVSSFSALAGEENYCGKIRKFKDGEIFLYISDMMKPQVLVSRDANDTLDINPDKLVGDKSYCLRGSLFFDAIGSRKFVLGTSMACEIPEGMISCTPIYNNQ